MKVTFSNRFQTEGKTQVCDPCLPAHFHFYDSSIPHKFMHLMNVQNQQDKQVFERMHQEAPQNYEGIVHFSMVDGSLLAVPTNATTFGMLREDASTMLDSYSGGIVPLRLVHRGRDWEDHVTLEEAGVCNFTTVWLTSNSTEAWRCGDDICA